MTGDPVEDEAYASLFRPAEPEPERVAPATGRLFRSGGAPEGTDAIPALDPGLRGRLRTVSERDEPEAEAAVTTSRERRSAPKAASRRARRESAVLDRREPTGPGLRARGVLVIVFGVALLTGLADVLLGAGLGWIWGLGLVLASGYAALRVRVGDGTFAITAPAIAALASVVTVAQLDTGGSAGSLLDRAVVAFFSLGDNWPWILGATALAGVLVAVRTRRARRG